MTDANDRFKDLSAIIEDAGIAGILRREAKPTTDDIICGYLSTNDPRWAVRLLVDLYDWHKSNQPFQVGDRVHVRPEYVHLGFTGGWTGFAPMFADEVGTVIAVEWSPSNREWSVLTEYENSYRFHEYPYTENGRFSVHDKPSSFSFWPEYLEPAPAPREPTDYERAQWGWGNYLILPEDGV